MLLNAPLLQRRQGYPADSSGVRASLVEEESVFYVDSGDRFNQEDAATAERGNRLRAAERKQAELLRRREQAVGRDDARREAMAAADAEHSARTTQLQLDGGKARRNVSGIPYDPINLSNRSGDAAARLQAEEMGLKARASARAEVLFNRGRSTNFDPVSGLPVTHQPRRYT